MTDEIRTYKSYRFIDKDPMIDKIRTIVQGVFRNHKGDISYGHTSEASGVSDTTLRNWFEGSTKRPQFATMCAVARGCGYDLALVKWRGEQKTASARRTKNGHAKNGKVK